MRHVLDMLRRFALASAPAAACCALLAVAWAGPLAPSAAAAPTSPAIEAKKAQQAATQADLAAKRAQVQSKVAEFVALGRELDRTRVEIAELSSQTVEADAEYNQSRASLSARAVELYRTDQLGMIGVLFGAQSIDDLITRAHYLVFMTGRDASLLREVRLRRTENLWLQESLANREQQLVSLQERADEQRKQIEADIAADQQEAMSIGADIVEMLRTANTASTGSAAPGTSGSKPSGTFDPDTVISETNFRNSASLSVEQIQGFLEQQPGTLDTYVGPDYKGQNKTAAQMISEACIKWGISPKVVLATLQKEQSLLSRTRTTKESMDWAMGCGKADSFTSYQYQGFGKQIWYGTYKLKQNADLWKPGATQKIDGSTVHPTNPGTHAQYRYTPHFPGVMSFWMIYWRYFGDPLAG